MTEKSELDKEIDASFARLRAQSMHSAPKVSPKKNKKQKTKIERVSHVVAWLMIIVTLGSVGVTAAIQLGLFN